MVERWYPIYIPVESLWITIVNPIKSTISPCFYPCDRFHDLSEAKWPTPQNGDFLICKNQDFTKTKMDLDRIYLGKL